MHQEINERMAYTMSDIKVAIVGVGNCASSFFQGLELLKSKEGKDFVGVMHSDIGGYEVTDIRVVAAFDVDRRKVNKDLAEAIFSAPNIAYQYPNLSLRKTGVKVLMGPIMDGVPEHLAQFVQISNEKPVDVVEVLRKSKAEILLNLLPTGSAQAARFYADCAIKEAKIAYMNGMPELICCDASYQEAAERGNVPIIGDDVKSQLGATIIHRALLDLFLHRGIKIEKTYQLNFAGNTDFLNLVNRGESKHKTKTEALTTAIPYPAEVSTGFSWIPLMKDRKTAIFHIIGSNFAGAPLRFEAKLEVEDSPNFAGVIAEGVRYLKLGLDRGIGGVLTSASAYLSKHPPAPMSDEEARKNLEEFIAGKRER